MDLSQRYKLAAKEARWALGLAIFYVIGWCICAYLPILFVVIGYWIVKIVFLDIPLDVESKENK